MLLLSKEDMKEVFTMRDAVEAVKESFRLFSAGKGEAPGHANIHAPEHGGSMMYTPSFVEEMDMGCLKVVNVTPENGEKGMPPSPAQVILIDSTNGMVVSVLDGHYVNELRTGAASGAAFDVLANKKCEKGALIGTGGHAATQLEAMLTVRDLDQVKVFDQDKDRLWAFVEKMNRELGDYGAQILAAESSDDAVEDADLLISATPSVAPVFDGSKVKKGATVSCVGSNQPHMQEMDPVVLKRASGIYFDSRKAVLSEAGDIIIPLETGLITEDDFTGDLGDVLLGDIEGRRSEEDIIVFKTVGIGTQDLVTAKKIYDKAVAAGVGTFLA